MTQRRVFSQLWRGLPDLAAIGGLVFLTAVYLSRRVQWHALPSEDALMLLRYSRYLADGHGIRWNIGDAPVEGATDFLFMFAVGTFSRLLHMGVIGIDRVLLSLAHLASVVLLYVGARRLFLWPVWASCCLALYLSVGLAASYITAGFSAPLFALFALAAWYAGLRMVVSGPSTRRGLALGALLLATGLTRPEGVLMDGFVLLALTLALRRDAPKMLLPALAVLIPLGSAYFVWRFRYFGYLLPNPFYLKGGGSLHPDAFKLSVNYMCLMLAPVLPFFALELFSANWRRAVVGLLPAFCFTCIWILLSNENNHAMRFQYCALPLTLLSLPYASRTFVERFGGSNVAFVSKWAMCALTLWFTVQYWAPYFRSATTENTLYNIATALRPFRDKGYTVATTEAGILPFFSEWRAIDLYGLNDAFITHHAEGPMVGYLARSMPAVILLHQPRAGLDTPAMSRTGAATRRFVETNDYKLAAAWGYDACDRQLWYVRQGLPETAAFMQIVSRAPYFVSGAPLPNLTAVPLPDQCMDTPVRLDLSR